MQKNHAVDDAVAEAVREKLTETKAALAEAQLEEERARALHELSKAKCEAIAEKKTALEAFLRRSGIAPDAAPGEATKGAGAGNATPLPHVSLRQQVLRVAAEMLRGGKKLKAQAIYEGLVQNGVQLKSGNPLQRVSQILSLDKRFVADRVNGWSLASDEEDSL